MKTGKTIFDGSAGFSIRYFSVRKRLSFFIGLLVLSIILVFGCISYFGVRKATLRAGEERLQNLSLQLGTMLSGSTHSLVTSNFTQANKPAIKTYLLTNGRDSLISVTRQLKRIFNDSNCLALELLSLTGERKFHYEKSKNGFVSSSVTSDSLIVNKLDTGLVGKLYPFQGRLYFPVIVKIKADKDLIGYLINWRRLTARGVDQINKLMGPDANFYIGNADGSVWTDLVKTIPAFHVQEEGIVQYERSGTQFLASSQAIKSSSWQVMVEYPLPKILKASEQFLYWLLLTGLALLLLGIGVTWLISCNISRPIKELTKATTEIAHGNYASQVPTGRLDELGKLARSFNAMAKQVQNSHAALQEKAENYTMLFQKNPMPMWIMSKGQLSFLDVNQAALNHYGYTRDAFMQLSALDLYPVEDIPRFMEAVNAKGAGRKKHGIWRHRKQDGNIIMVDLITDDLIYNNQAAILVLAHDITEKLKAEAELVRHRIMQQELITETTILVQEKEREEIGKELHDNINQILTATKLYLELAMTGNKELTNEALSKSYNNINLVMGEIRQLSKQLVRPAFDTSLADALKDLTEEIRAITPLDIYFTAEGFDESMVDETIRLMIYRVVQEQLNNILKHAAASEVRIDIKTEGDQLRLIISDNGVGFDLNQKSKGIGLRNIDNRVKFHRGIVSIHSRPGEGCVVKIVVPTQREAATAS